MVSRKAFQFFSEQAGGIVGERAKGAIALARSEALLERAVELEVASCEWVDDDEPYDAGDATSPEDAARYFEENTWTGPFGCVVKVGDEGHASLWGIVVGPRGTDDPYCRVVAAELAWECEDDLRQAIGDALDLEAARGGAGRRASEHARAGVRMIAANRRVVSASVHRDYASHPAPVVVEVPALEPRPKREGYASTILGRPCWIAHDFRNAPLKAREDCTPFSYTLADGGDAVAQERFVKGLAKLERATARAAKARAPKVAPAKAAKVATVRMRAGVLLEVLGLPRGYSFRVEEVV